MKWSHCGLVALRFRCKVTSDEGAWRTARCCYKSVTLQLNVHYSNINLELHHCKETPRVLRTTTVLLKTGSDFRAVFSLSLLVLETVRMLTYLIYAEDRGGTSW